jgi:uncharacterized protein (DUF58 family)
MDFTLLPGLTAFMIGFVLVAALSIALALTTTTRFFLQNHVVRVRRHESIRTYYGRHLALTH